MSLTLSPRELAPGFAISPILTGLWQIADMERTGEVDLDRAAEAMGEYCQRGFTSFDMADHYGSAEEVAGRFISRRTNPSQGQSEAAGREGAGVQLLTKWVPKPGPVQREDVRQAVERSLHRLQSPWIDLLQFHAWSYADPSWLDALFYLQELKQEGRIRHLGLTNFDAAHLRIALESGIEILTNQVCFSLLDRRPRAGMSELCRSHGVKVLAYGTLAGGFLTDRWLGQPEPALETLPTWSLMKYKRFIDVAGGWDALQGVLNAAHAIAAAHEVSLANVACRWVLDEPNVGGIIVGARLGDREHLEDNVRIASLELSPEEKETIEAALNALTAIPGDSGDEYRKPPFLTASGDLSHHLDEFPSPYEVRVGLDGTKRVFSGTSWERMAGFCRAVDTGDRISISGTTATHGERAIGGSDPAAQFHFIVDKIEGVLQSLGARLEDVVRTRVFVRNVADWEPVARAHGERFGNILPANTLVQAELIGEEYLVEVEAEAAIPA